MTKIVPAFFKDGYIYIVYYHSTLVGLCIVSEKPRGPTGTSSGLITERTHTNTVQRCTWTQTEPVQNPPPQNRHHCCPETCQRGQRTGPTRG